MLHASQARWGDRTRHGHILANHCCFSGPVCHIHSDTLPEADLLELAIGAECCFCPRTDSI